MIKFWMDEVRLKIFTNYFAEDGIVRIPFLYVKGVNNFPSRYSIYIYNVKISMDFLNKGSIF